jgi:Ca-activated chloride channel family protein
MRRVIGLLALVALGIVGVTHAQGTTATIRGKVLDASGAAVAGATVTVIGEVASGESTTQTGADGKYSVAGLAPGKYTVKFVLAGFKTLEMRGVSLRAGQTRVIDATLEVSSMQESVVVMAAPSRPGRMKASGAVVGGLGAPAPPGMLPLQMAAPPFNTEGYDRIDELGFRDPRKNPLSTFSIDVDTASYANMRRFINQGALPPKDAVRIEELINYFHYDYPQPKGDAPFSVSTEVGACPWKSTHKLLLIGLQGKVLDTSQRPPANLVFLIDVSGSMQDPLKLPLLKSSLKLLVNQLAPKDQVAIVVYAGAAGLVLPRTSGENKAKIADAIDRLEAGGSTQGSAGIQLAYETAQQGLIKGGINRVVLATDGDFNVGITDAGALTRLIEEKRESGIFLSVLGFGTGNVKDSTMEKLADRGNGNYNYIDSLQEGRKVLVSQAAGTLVTIAKDVKIQVEFNPTHVAAYRLIGYENRMLKDEDFKDDRKDAGDIGAGHSVTALYEIVPRGEQTDVPGVDPLRYQKEGQLSQAAATGELATVKLRYKAPDASESVPMSVAVTDAAVKGKELSANLGFAAAVAELGMILRESEHKGAANYGQVLELARRYRGEDAEGYRVDFVKLVELAKELKR